MFRGHRIAIGQFSTWMDGGYQTCYLPAFTSYAVDNEMFFQPIPKITFLVQPFLVELIGVEFPYETYQSQH